MGTGAGVGMNLLGRKGLAALLVVVPAASEPATAKSVFDFLEGKIAKWWMLDDVIFVEALTYGATGKVQKMELRGRFVEHYASQKAG